MKDWTRRDVLKSSAVVSAAAAPHVNAEPQAGATPNRPAQAGGSPRERLLLDFGWRFHFGHADDPSKDLGMGSGRTGNFMKTGNFLPAGRSNFDDSEWKAVDLPHDWAIELPFQNDPALSSKGFYPLGRAYPATSIGWYRRIFELPAGDAGKRITIEFDAAYRRALVVFNGFYIGEHNGGYDPFSFDVTDFTNFGGRNVLLVRVDATMSDGWFYEGAGIYRHVWLVKTAPVHVKQWGTFVRAKVGPGEAAVSIRTEVNNHAEGAQNARVVSTILDPAGKVVGRAAAMPASIPEWKDHTFEQQVVVKQPALWSLEQRNLYRLVTEVEAGGKIVDRYETRFGIRTCAFDGEKGFFLNGKPVKIKGTCNHQDHAGLGAALPDAVQYFRIRKLIEMGCNGYRTSHNPPTPELLDACDDLGMLVFDETRMMSSNPEGLSQFTNMVRRDRNHPSVFMWSMGNEEGEAPTARGLEILTSMKQAATMHDGTRPVSIAPLGGNTMGQGGLAECDVQGYNYADPASEVFHKAHPKVPVIGTETVSAVGTRGRYAIERDKGYVSCYDPWTTTGRASAEGWWSFCNAREWNSGGFIWTGFDYRGEPSPYQWPNISSQYGIIDTCGFPKDTFFYYQSWWTGKPVLHVFPHWNWPGLEGKDIDVWVHSNLEKVELFLNGKSLGAKEMKKDSHLEWRVTYTPGTIEARGYQGGKVVLTAKRETTGPAAKLAASADRSAINADGEDVVMVAIEVQDAQGRVVPETDNVVSFHVSGAGKLIGVGNGDPTCHESDKGSQRKAFSGLCMAIVQAAKEAGAIAVEATSPGLAPARVTVQANAAPLRPALPAWEREIPTGEGITGLWRPVPVAAAQGPFGGFGAMGADTLFSFKQQGSQLTGGVEGAGGRGFGGGGGEEPAPISEGKVDGSSISFKVGTVTYTGKVNGEQIQLERSGGFGFPGGGGGRAGERTVPPGPASLPGEFAVGPPPAGTDQSRSAGMGMGRMVQPAPILLRRTNR
jgi:beta-galactosidase